MPPRSTLLACAAFIFMLAAAAHAPAQRPGASGLAPPFTATAPAPAAPPADAPPAPAHDAIKLAPPSERVAAVGEHGIATTKPSSPLPSALTVLASLAFVLGLFAVAVWLLRRGMPGSPNMLPGGVVEVLGRTPLVGRDQMHLVRFGNKLLLVAVSPGGCETLSEVTDPLEVDRLAGLCHAAQPGSVSESFKNILGQITGESRRLPPDDEQTKKVRQALSPVAARYREASDA